MARFSFASLRVRLLLFVFLALLPLLVLILYTAGEQRRMVTAGAQEDTLRLLRQASWDYEQLIEETHQLLAVSAQLPAIRSGDYDACPSLFNDLVKRRPSYDSFNLIKPGGEVICPQAGGTVNLLDRDYFQLALKSRDFVVGDYVISRITGRPVLPVAYPVLDQQGEVRAVLVVTIDLSWLNRLAANAQLPEGATLTVVDRYGTVLSRNLDPGDLVGKSVAETPVVQAVLSQKTEGTAESAGIDGVRRLYAYMPLHRTAEGGDVYIYAGIPTRIVYAGVSRLLARNLAGVGLATVLVLVFAWLGSNLFFLRQVNVLLDATRRLTAGDQGARTGPPYGPGELGQLARAFDHMAEALGQSTSQLRQAEIKYRTLVERVPAVTYIAALDEKSTTLYVSPQVKTVLSLAPERMLAEPGLRLGQVHAEDRRRVQAELQRSYSGGEPFCLEYRMLKGDGAEVWVHDEARAVLDGEGRPQFLQGILVDITRRKQAEEALEKLSRQNELILNSAGEGIFGIDRHGITTFANPAAAKMLGYEVEEIVDRPSHAICHHTKVDGSAYPEEECPINMVYKDGVVHEAQDEVFWKKDGTSFPVEYTSTPIWEKGELAGAVVVFKDITGRKRAEEEVMRRSEHLQALRNIDLAITGSLDLRVTFNVVLDQVIHQLGIHAADILLLNPHTRTLEYAAGRGFRQQGIERSRLRLGEGYAGRAVFERCVISLNSISEAGDAFLRAPLLEGEDFVAYYAVPLIAKGQVKGLLEIFHREGLNPGRDWLDFLETLAGQAAIAIDNATLFEGMQRSNIELTLAYDDTIEGWSRALDLRDKETEGHSRRVTEMSLRLARALGMGEDELVHVRRGALLHDIGKMGVPDHVLLKPGPLTEEEWVIMRRHPVHAYEMLSPITYLRRALDIPYCHHEKWDGTGYPRGLKGEQIPFAARIFAVVDVWDALCSQRPYRTAWPEEKVLGHIRGQTGKHFDPAIVEASLKIRPRADYTAKNKTVRGDVPGG